MSSKHIIVRGKVQGVFFRYYTQKKAKELGLVGDVQNLSNGNVAIRVSGNENKIKEFIAWCHHGSPASSVSNIEIVDSQLTISTSEFKIIR
jgi:acylphosphatase